VWCGVGWEDQLSVVATLTPVDTALALAAAGLSVIPIKPDGTKSPAVGSWSEFQNRIAKPEEIRSMFRPGMGVAIVAGKASGNVEILDIESNAPFSEFQDLIREHAPELLDKLPHVETPSGGHHLFYRCDEIAGNQKLAMRIDGNNKPEVMIETRGHGGYVVTVNSPAACHETRREYRLVHGRLTQIPRISPAERGLLLDAARSFNRVVREAKVDRKPSASTNGNGHGARPGDLFNARVSWTEVLEVHGWKPVGERGEETFWRRPGKDFGFSATTNYRGSDVLYVFSRNADPFEHETSYSKFAAHALLNHAGDYKAAAQAIAEKFGMKDEQNHDRPKAVMDEEREAIRQEGAGHSPAAESYADELLERLAIQREADEKAVKQYADARRRLGAVPLSSVQAEHVSWLWFQRVARGKVTMVEGDPGIGKSTMTLAIAAAETRGYGLPGEASREPGRVLIIPAEDGVVDTVLPRLTALGADLALIEAIEKPLTLDAAGCTLLHNYMTGFGPTLTIIDPLFAYVGNRDTNKQGDARQIMDKLARLARHHNCAIVCVRHLNKGSRDKSIYRGGGSIDFTAAARSVLLVGADPTDIQRRAVVQIKNNLAPIADPVGFTIEHAQFAWTGKSDLTAEHILASDKDAATEISSVNEAIDFLNEALANGPVAQKQLKREAAQAGIADRTLYRAKEKLRIKSRKSGFDGNWTWEPPKVANEGGQ